jgi:hypothetical protein
LAISHEVSSNIGSAGPSVSCTLRALRVVQASSGVAYQMDHPLSFCTHQNASIAKQLYDNNPGTSVHTSQSMRLVAVCLFNQPDSATCAI